MILMMPDSEKGFIWRLAYFGIILGARSIVLDRQCSSGWHTS